MITSISGLLVEASPIRAVIELNGFGYEVNVPVTTTERMPQVGQAVKALRPLRIGISSAC